MKIDQLHIGRALLTAASGLGLGYAIAFSILCATHTILFDSTGHPVPFDFAEFWSAGKLALSGRVLDAYDPNLIHSAEVATVGHPFGTFIGWFYPPSFFFIAVALASLPPAVAFVAWTNATLLLCSAAVAAITRRWEAAFVALAAPWAMLCMVEGQTGLLTAAIIGAVLLTLERHPRLSGIMLGVLSYKPHFGLLFPLILIFGGYWRTFFWACASTVVITVLACAVFGAASLPAFFHALTGAVQVHLVTKPPSAWPGLQSVYALARARHVPLSISILLQSALSGAVVVSLLYTWRTRLGYALKAAALAAAVPLATPYVWAYDMPLLSITLAYLYRDRPFDRLEWWVIVLMVIAAVAAIHYPGGLVANLLAAALVARRVFGELKQMRRARSPNETVELSARMASANGLS